MGRSKVLEVDEGVGDRMGQAFFCQDLLLSFGSELRKGLTMVSKHL